VTGTLRYGARAIETDKGRILSGALDALRPERPAGVFDLDGTLLTNKPRQARIVRDFGRERGSQALARCEPGMIVSWDLRDTMRLCGLDSAEIEDRDEDLRAYWLERFFTSEYCTEDVAIDGAAAFTHAVASTGAQLVYVTGRHEGMREGTVEAMRRGGLVLPGQGSTLLLMKPTLRESDDAFKREAHARLGTLGRVIAAFDNEPTHANDYQRRFPEATVVHLATDHSGRPVDLLEAVISSPHFTGVL
jgi:hypothetical protein